MDSYTQLKRDEGEVLHAYQDHLGFWTIGIGILIDERKGGGLLPEESEFIFRNRLKLLDADLTAKLPWMAKLDPARRGVLINMAYQMGAAGLMAFKTTLELVRLGNYREASKAMMQSKWATQTPARAQRLSNQMATGEWQ